MISNLPLTPPNVEPDVIDLVESSDNPTRPVISILPPSLDFGQSCVVLPSDSQDSIMSFHTVSPSLDPQSEQPSTQPDQQPEELTEMEHEQDNQGPE